MAHYKKAEKQRNLSFKWIQTTGYLTSFWKWNSEILNYFLQEEIEFCEVKHIQSLLEMGFMKSKSLTNFIPS